MKIKAIKTRKVTPPQDSIEDILDMVAKSLKHRCILAITSKIVSIHEGRTIPSESVRKKDELIISEAEMYLPRELTPGGWVMHTLKTNLLIPTAGIDESNAANYYVLWPEDPQKSAKRIWNYLNKITGIPDFGVIITDSHSIVLRRGVVGISLSHFGFEPLYDYRGKKDIFGRKLKVSQTNIADSLASAAVLVMGEGAERTPLSLISDLPHTVKFKKRKIKQEGLFSNFEVSLEEDLYEPFLSAVPWKKGGKFQK